MLVSLSVRAEGVSIFTHFLPNRKEYPFVPVHTHSVRFFQKPRRPAFCPTPELANSDCSAQTTCGLVKLCLPMSRPDPSQVKTGQSMGFSLRPRLWSAVCPNG